MSSLLSQHSKLVLCCFNDFSGKFSCTVDNPGYRTCMTKKEMVFLAQGESIRGICSYWGRRHAAAAAAAARLSLASQKWPTKKLSIILRVCFRLVAW